MDDLIIPKHDEQPSHAALRAEFRATALANLRAQFSSHHQLGWSVIGDPAQARSTYSAAEWAMELDRRLTAPVTQDFGLSGAPASLGSTLEHQASDAATFDLVSIPGGVDHDAPALGCPVELMTDDEICDYVDAAIKESAREL